MKKKRKKIKPKTDAINHPKHYNFSKIEVIEAIEAWELNYHCGNTVKYVARAGRKDPKTEIQDLEKAQWYLNRKIALLKKQKFKTRLPKPDKMK